MFICFMCSPNLCVQFALLIPLLKGLCIAPYTSFTQYHSTRVHSTMKTLSGAIVPLHPWYP